MSWTPAEVSFAAWATPVMFWAISELPFAASATLRLISLVVAVCSSTALAMVFWRSLIWLMMALIWAMAETAPRVSPWMASIFCPMPPPPSRPRWWRSARAGWSAARST
jgi:hypothetical protein